MEESERNDCLGPSGQRCSEAVKYCSRMRQSGDLAVLDVDPNNLATQHGPTGEDKVMWKGLTEVDVGKGKEAFYRCVSGYFRRNHFGGKTG